MLSECELLTLMGDLESDRVERTISEKDTDKFCIAACAFANDFPQHKQPGYLLVGVSDKGRASGLKVTHQLLRTLGEVRANGNVLPLPALQVYRLALSDGTGEVAVMEVLPSDLPPVRYKGQVWIRVGPRRVVASETEERILTERRTAAARTFDARPCFGSTIEDLEVDLFLLGYRAKAFAPEVVAQNHREVPLQLAALRFFDLRHDCPTNAGILLFGKNPLHWFPGAYLQFLRVDGDALGAPVVAEQRLRGDLFTVLRELDLLLNVTIQSRPVPVSALREEQVFPYPKPAIRELVLNALMHRDYEATGATRYYVLNDHLEVQSPGALYGEANAHNFPDVNAYRNPILAEAARNLGYINRFGQGIRRVQRELQENGNPPAEFCYDSTFFRATVRPRLG